MSLAFEAAISLKAEPYGHLPAAERCLVGKTSLAVDSHLGMDSWTESHGCSWVEGARQALFEGKFVVGAGKGINVVHHKTQGDPSPSCEIINHR